jgi:hypothetical protein
MADVAPIPMASEQTLTSVNPGLFSNNRKACRNDFSIELTYDASAEKVRSN